MLPTFPIPSIGDKYTPEAVAYFAAHSVQLSNAQKKVVDNFVRTLLNQGLWAKLGLLCIHHLPQQQQSLVDLIVPSRSLSIVGSPTFTANQGWKPNSSTANRLSTPVNITDASLKFNANDAHYGVWTDPTSNGNFIAAGTVSQHNWLEPNSSGTMWGRIQGTANTPTVAGAGGNGLHVMNRSSSSNVEMYYNGSQIYSGSNASTARSAEVMNFLNAGGSVVGDSTVQISHMGSSLNSTEQTNLYNAINTLLANL